MASTAIALDHVRPPYLDALRSEAARRGLGVVAAPCEIAEAAGSRRVALAVLQVDGIEAGGIERVRSVRKLLDGAPSVVVGRELDPESVFELSRLGIADVIRLPDTPEDVATRCFAHLDLGPEDELAGLVGSSQAMEAVRQAVWRISPTRCNVLITGETGTGKGLVARAIHRVAGGSNDKLVQVDCAALSPTLIESELFGHERGAFTGAVAARAGRFETAGHGIIFLDEIGELDLPLQSKFLRVLEDREFERVGGNTTLRMNARVIAATSRDLDAELAKGNFRADLYYRLKVVHLHMPPLRERLSDVPLLIESGLADLARQLGVAEVELSQPAVDRLMLHSWPGNVRELLNTLEALLVRHAGSRIDVGDVEELLRPAPRAAEVPTLDVPEAPLASPASAAEERAQILKLLVETGGNVARVARRMDMARSTIRYKIRRYGLQSYIPRD